MSSRLLLATLGAALLSTAVVGQAPDAPGDTAPIEEIVVTGEYPGPGLWKVTREGDPV